MPVGMAFLKPCLLLLTDDGWRNLAHKSSIHDTPWAPRIYDRTINYDPTWLTFQVDSLLENGTLQLQCRATVLFRPQSRYLLPVPKSKYTSHTSWTHFGYKIFVFSYEHALFREQVRYSDGGGLIIDSKDD